MGKCIEKDCGSHSQKNKKADGITFHTVPKDPIRRAKWVEIIRLLRRETDWLPSKTSHICSKHFQDEDKIEPINENGRVYLSDTALPVFVEESNIAEHIVLIKAEKLDTDDDTDTDEDINRIITETPREEKMARVITHLRLVSSRRLKKIKNLTHKNKRLKIKTKKLNDMVKELKN